jgi:diacylglycerol kinase family enzyme
VDTVDTLSAYSAGEQARESVANGFDTIFVCGGDGTFFQVLQGVAGSEAALGVIPMGTGNVLAQNLCLPRDPVAALRAQMDVEAVSIPLGEVICKVPGETPAEHTERKWYFTIAAGAGMHAALMDMAPNGNGKRFMGKAAYFLGGFRLLLSYSIQPFDVEMTGADGEVHRFQASELLAVRVPAINVWRPGGNLCSSQLRMAAVPPVGRFGLGHAMFHALVTGKSSEGRNDAGRPYPRYEDAVRIVCKPVAGITYAAPLLVEADGEVVGLEQATFQMSEKRFRLIFPRS